MSDMTLFPPELPYDRRRFSRYWDFYRVPPLRRRGGLFPRQVLGSAPARLQRDRSYYLPNRRPDDEVLIPEDYCTNYINGGEVTPDRLAFALRLFDAPPEPPRTPRPAQAVPFATLAAPLAVPPAASPPPLSPWQIAEVDTRRFLAAYRLRRRFKRYFLRDLDSVRAANPSLYRYYEDGLDDDSTEVRMDLDSADLASSSSSSSSSSAGSNHKHHDQHRRNRDDDDDDDDLDYDDARRESLARFAAIALVGSHEGGVYQSTRMAEGRPSATVIYRGTRLAALPTRHPTPRGWWSPNTATDVLPDRYTGAMMFTPPSSALSTHSKAGYRRDGGGGLVRFRRASSAPAVISLQDVITEDKQTQERIVHRDPPPSMPIKQRLTDDDTTRATLFDSIRTLHRFSRDHSNADAELGRKAYEAIASLFGWEPWAKGELDMPGVRILPWSVHTSVMVNMFIVPRKYEALLRHELEEREQPRSDPNAPEVSEGYGTAARTSAAVPGPSVQATGGQGSVTATPKGNGSATSEPRRRWSWSEGDNVAPLVDWHISPKPKAPAISETDEDDYDDPDPDEQAEVGEEDVPLFDITALDPPLEQAFPTRENGCQTTIKDFQPRDPKASSPLDPPTSQQPVTTGESSAAAAFPAAATSVPLNKLPAGPPLFAPANPYLRWGVLPSPPEEPSRRSRVRGLVKKAFRTETLGKPFLKLRGRVQGRKKDKMHKWEGRAVNTGPWVPVQGPPSQLSALWSADGRFMGRSW